MWRSAIKSEISIHAPREGSDRPCRAVERHQDHFNPRSPRGERRHARDAINMFLLYFNPRSPRGERPDVTVAPWAGLDISIHAPREGSDYIFAVLRLILGHFNPRSPRGERLILPTQKDSFFFISIHAPREGSDADAAYILHDQDISIHAPREGSDILYC